jgi:hypothetical protein
MRMTAPYRSHRPFMAPDYPAETQSGMRDSSSRGSVQPRRSRSRSRPSNGGLGRADLLSPRLYSVAQPFKAMHALARGDSQSPQSMLTGFDMSRLQRACDAAELRQGRADPAPGFRKGQRHGLNSPDDLGPPHSAKNLHPSQHRPEEDCRGRPLRAHEERQYRAGADRAPDRAPDGPRHQGLRELFSGREIIRSGGPRQDLWRPGGKGFDCACGVFIYVVGFGNSRGIILVVVLRRGVSAC